MDIKLGIDKLDVPDGPLFGSDRGWSCLEMTDAMRREALRIRSMDRISDDSGCSLIVSPDQNYVCEEEMSLANMNMDVEYQYETLNGLPVYMVVICMIRRMRRTILWSGRVRSM